MALNIPNVGTDRSGLFKGLLYGHQMQQNKAQLAQQWQQHLNNLEIQRQQQERLAQEHAMNQALHPYKLMAAQQAQLLGPLNMQLLQERIRAQQALVNQRSPEYAKQEIQNILNMFSSGEGGEPSQNPNAPTKEQIIRGIFKKKLGYDLFAPTEEQKAAQRLEEFKQKEEIKKRNKGEIDLTAPTKATITANQAVINSANNIIPQVEHLKKISLPNPISGQFTSPNDFANYEAVTNSIADGLMAAFGWPKTDQALQMAKQLVKRKPLEKESSYHNRLSGLISELKQRRENANNILTGSKVKPHTNEESGQMITIRNKRTGQTETVSIEEAKRRGAIK